MNDWRSYDAIAKAYQRVWAARFQDVARHLLALASPAEGTRLLDLGTGTGVVALALGERLATPGLMAGCDLSLPMLREARRLAAGLRPVVADAARLPFPAASFDLATANCVLSHLVDRDRALAEVLRVLARPSTFAVSSWGPSSDPYAAAWQALLDHAVGDGATQRSVEQVTPWEGHLSSPDAVREVLVHAGFGSVRVEEARISYDQSVPEFLADRELGSAGRYARHVLGDAGWPFFLERADARLRRAFGDRVRYDRPLVLGVGVLR